ncbi:RadC family protein [Hufsiella ginkgonis]|uniref:DNA repair protein RadC n=1 Tax=Hufsiella ginkgonis TaxID=2695274 RepID=A0A7K1XRS2_9SPHI|nr:DNA repair protein RadC [Hufsiella ginkgonis]MXV13691.1 DNA repair protein RadC [Hufsiella ginkgonis]
MKTGEAKLTVKTWAEDDRPREKLVRHGRRTLTDAELIAILICSGSSTETSVELSKRILASIGNDLERLGTVSVDHLSSFKGIGPAKSVTIIAALELGRRRKASRPENKIKIGQSRDIYQLMSPFFLDLNQEEFRILLLNRANKVISQHLVSTGGQAGTIADPKVIFKIAIEHHASSLILAHNHPSGSLKPSKADIGLTSKLCAAGNLLDIIVLDHLIFAGSSYFSFADEGMI